MMIHWITMFLHCLIHRYYPCPNKLVHTNPNPHQVLFIYIYTLLHFRVGHQTSIQTGWYQRVQSGLLRTKLSPVLSPLAQLH